MRQNKAALMEKPDSIAQLLKQFIRRVRKNLHFLMIMPPNSKNFREMLLRHQTLMCTSQIVWI